MRQLASIVLAAGEGSRLKSRLAKPLHKVGGKTMLEHVIATLRQIGGQRVTVVVGVAREQVIAALPDGDVEIAIQEQQLGTGHAVDSARDLYRDFEGDIICTYVDIPLITPETLLHLVEQHREQGAAATMLTTIVDDPAGYGRVIRDDAGMFAGVVEHRDADEATLAIREINTGIYCFRGPELFEALRHVDNDNSQGEYYLPDVLKWLRAEGLPVAGCVATDPDELMGINDRIQLAQADTICRRRVRETLMRDGVTMIEPDSICIDAGVRIGRDTIIRPGAIIEGESTIGEDCEIGGNCCIRNSTIGDGCIIRHCSSITDSTIEDRAEIGPFANIRGNSTVGRGAAIGSCAEVNRSTIGPGSKSRHFSYLGDSVIGSDVNIGAGTITCNFDGFRKHQTSIGDGAFVGSDTIFIAPVEVGRGAVTGAGSVITDDVAEGALGIARARQTVIEHWAERRRQERGDSVHE